MVGDFNAEIGFRGVGQDVALGIRAHGRRTRSGHQLIEWAQGEDRRLLLSFTKASQLRFLGLRLELNRRVAATWFEVVSLGVGVARAVLGEEPLQDSHPWVRSSSQELSAYDYVVSRASVRMRQAEFWRGVA